MRQLDLPGGVRLSRVGLGTWQFGSTEWGYGRDYAAREAKAIVRRALDLGVTLFDSAEAYAFGRSERILGEALRGRRSEAFVATKLLPVLPLAAVVEQRAHASARRLGVERIDLYQLHWPNPAVPLAQTMRGMRHLQQEGLVAQVGVSNYSLAGWKAAEAALGSMVLSNQVQYSLVHRRPELDLLGHAADAGRALIAYSPLAQGFLSGRYRAGNSPGGVRATNPLFLPDNLERAAPLLDLLREVARAHDAQPAQVALAWLLRRPNVVVIPGARSVEQLEANAAAADLELSDEQDRALSRASDAFVPVSWPEALPRLARGWWDRRGRPGR